MAAAPHYTKEQRQQKMADFLKVYENSYGLLYRSCKEAGVDDLTIYKWKEKYPEFGKAVAEIDQRVKDQVIGKLMEKVLAGDRASIFFWLKCRAHWSETQKIEVSNGNDFDVEAAIEDLQKTFKKK